MRIKDKLQTIDFLIVNDAIKTVAENKKKILDSYVEGEIDAPLFYKSTALLTPQSRSALYENALIRKLGGTKNNARDNIGDAKIAGTNYEIKVSGVNIDKCLHMVQLRPWQNTDYLIQFIDVDRDFKSLYFVLTHEEMIAEIKETKANATHGTMESNKNNQNIEYRITLKKGSVHFRRWVSKYQVDISTGEIKKI